VEGLTEGKIEVTDSYGRLIFCTEIKNGPLQIDLRQYANGIYFVAVKHNGRQAGGQKLIKFD
jgi:hypothetical protein